jgi:predicted transcriptional regulator
MLPNYLDLLTDLKLLKVSHNPRKNYYQITPTGKAFLDDSKCFEETEDN